jgi:hypothetical protein
MPDGGTPKKAHRTEPWASNSDGPRSLAQALDLVKKYGVTIPDDVRFFATEDCIPADAHAAYHLVYEQSGQAVVSWQKFYNRNKCIPIRVRKSVFASDEAIVAIFAHELYETALSATSSVKLLPTL